jgi:hypothetical protein
MKSRSVGSTALSVRRWLARAAIAVAAIVLAGCPGRQVLNRYAERRALAALQSSYDTRVQVASLHVRLFPGVRVTAEGITLPQRKRPGLPPFIFIRRVSAEASVPGVLRGPAHVAFAQLEGLEIHVPPRREGASRKGRTPEFVIDQLRADNARLEILPRNANKQPLEFDIRELTMNDAGAATPMRFRAILTNARPTGDIHSAGKFGPLQLDDPAASPVEGSYTFQNADLSVFKGIAGILSSQGSYRGALDHIEVKGHTDTPRFSVLLSGNPVRLTTQFQAVVDRMNGDTRLNQVNGQLGHTSLTVTGAVDGTKGRFKLNDGVMQFDNLLFQIPGVQVALNGTYGLPDEKLDMHGTASLEAKISETVTGFKSFLLKAIDPLFAKKGKGAVVPIRIGGTPSAPTIGLDGGQTLKQALGGTADAGAGRAK